MKTKLASRIRKSALRPEFCELLEEGFTQAARAISEERRNYIANLLCNGLAADQVDYVKSRFLLRLLNQLSNAEIIVLNYYGLGHPKVMS
jgi:hypothetical protein